MLESSADEDTQIYCLIRELGKLDCRLLSFSKHGYISCKTKFPFSRLVGAAFGSGLEAHELRENDRLNQLSMTRLIAIGECKPSMLGNCYR